MQIFSLNIEPFISKINDYVIFIISFLQTTFNNIIAIRNIDFSLGNILNSSGIILSFILSIFYILIFLTFLVFIGSIFDMIKKIIKFILFPLKLMMLIIYKIINKLFTNSFVKPTIKINNFNKYDLIKLQRKISDLEYKINLQKRNNSMKSLNNKNYKQSR
jgi:hypothetical protein